MRVDMVDLEEAYGWLNSFEPSDVSHCSGDLVRQMDHAYLKGDYDKAFLILRPESDNPEHKEFVFTLADKGFDIRGDCPGGLQANLSVFLIAR
jgi:hypothetical protein